MNIVKDLIRTLKSSTELNLRTEIGPSHPLIPWIIEHAAQFKNRYMVSADGRTPTERVRGRGVQRPVYEFGEKVLFSLPAPTRRGDFGARFDYGIYLGSRPINGQAYVGTLSGVISCRTVRQLSAQERWDTEFVLSIEGTPHNATMQTWPILTVTGGDPESRLERKGKQRESGSMSLMVKKAMNGWRLERNGCEFTVVPDEICSLTIILMLELSDISKRRESIVCSTDGGEWRNLDRCDDKGSENHEPPQDLPQEWTGSTRYRKSWEC